MAEVNIKENLKQWNAKKPKIKVLAYCDSPTCATGFGTVSRNIFEGLHRTGRYDIDILGVNYWGDPHNFPYRIWPVGTNAQNDPYGRKKVFNMIPQMDFDLLFFLQDTFILDFLPELIPLLKQQGKKFKSICYFPVDGMPKKQWIKNVCAVDYPIAYSNYGAMMAMEACPECSLIDIINHGVNVRDFFPLPKERIGEFRNMYFGQYADRFIFMNLNRNQQRKDIPRTIQAFVEFRKQVPESLLYLHMAPRDHGWDLIEVCNTYGLNTTRDVIFPKDFDPNQGYPVSVVNQLYNAVDCVVSTTLGEGWGLSWSEAMATNTPVIMPGNTALTEAVGEDKGYLVNSGTNPSLFTVLPNDNNVIRPLVDVEDLVEKMVMVYNNYEEALVRAEKAYQWVQNELRWGTDGHIVRRWINVFDMMHNELLEDRKKSDSYISEQGKIKAEKL